MYQEYLIRRKVEYYPLPHGTPDQVTEHVPVPFGTFHQVEAPERYEDHALLLIRVPAGTVVEEPFWASSDDMLALDTDLAHAHGLYTNGVLPCSVPVSVESERAARLSLLRQRTTEHILSRYPDFKQRNVAMGIESEAYAEECRAFITGARARFDATEKKLNEAATVTELRRVPLDVNNADAE